MRETLTIRIPKIKLFGYHGCYDQEKKEGQEFEINMEIVLSIEYPISKNYPMVEDGLEAVFDYTKIVEAIKITFEGRRVNLLETLCEKICCIPEALREEEKRRWEVAVNRAKERGLDKGEGSKKNSLDNIADKRGNSKSRRNPTTHANILIKETSRKCICFEREFSDLAL